MYVRQPEHPAAAKARAEAQSVSQEVCITLDEYLSRFCDQWNTQNINFQ